jgi:hypothetical protein
LNLFQVLFRALRDSECKVKCKSRKPRIMCGSDGVSYNSKCELKRARRCEGKKVSIVRKGKCSGMLIVVLALSKVLLFSKLWKASGSANWGAITYFFLFIQLSIIVLHLQDIFNAFIFVAIKGHFRGFLNSWFYIPKQCLHTVSVILYFFLAFNSWKY